VYLFQKFAVKGVHSVKVSPMSGQLEV